MPKPIPTTKPNISRLEKAIKALVQTRQRPLLILYYPAFARMQPWDVATVYDLLRKHGLTKEKPIESIDLLVDTYGGDPTAAYALAQAIKLFSKNVMVMVADHAFSAGTLLAFVGTSVLIHKWRDTCESSP